MKKIISFIFLCGVLYITYSYKTEITKYLMDNYIYKKEIKIPESNIYKRDYDFDLIKETDNFFPNNKEELYNVLYTILNNGYSSFTFYCGDEYKTCSDDIKQIIDNENDILAIINNYVHPYNSYSTVTINMNNLGRITVDVEKLYTPSDINKINAFINTTYTSLIKDTMSDKEKIKIIHDFIINNTVYDKEWEKSDKKINSRKSNTAYGPLLNHIGLCGGYTDAMELFLDKMNIKSYKIASEKHIWNYVYIDNDWRHLDLTWDDPVTNTGKNILQYDYYLINTLTLENKKDNEHTYDKNFYIEAK